jgi:hypothetical protein
MARILEEASTFEDARKQLAPYVRNRQETIKIRWLLAAFLASQNELITEDQHYWSFLSNPPDGQARNPSSRYASGARGDYLKALQDYRLARQEHAKLRGSDEPQGSTPSRGAGRKVSDGVGPLSDYLDLLKERRRYERLKILTDYNDLLKAKSPARADYLDVSDTPDQQFTTKHNGQSLKPSSSSLSSLAHLTAGLDKAVLQAKHNLQAEHRMLHSTDTAFSTTEQARLHSKRQGLIRIRDELVIWVENELSHTLNSVNSEILDGDTATPKPRRIEDYLTATRDTYCQYIEARRLLLNAGNFSHDESKRGRLDIEPTKSDTTSTEGSGIAHDIISVLDGIILPIHQAQKSVILQKSLITTTIAKQQRSALQDAQGLIEESTLMAKYINSKEGSQHSKGGMDSTFRGQPKSRSGEEVIEFSSEWATAADRARAELHQLAMADVEHGHESIQVAQQQFCELKSLEGRALEDDGDVKSSETDTDDIWTEDIQTARRRTRSRRARRPRSNHGEESAGLWQKLNGRLGAIGDGV